MRASSERPPRRPTPRSLNVLNVEAENNPQFQATQLWNRITRAFCRDVPRKRHRKSLRFYDDTFTGKEAVDFLLGALPHLLDENRDVTRAKCVLLMEKFLENDIVRPVRADEVAFKDTTELYRLSPSAEEIAWAAKQPFVRRTASFSDKKANKSRFGLQQQKIPPTPKIAPLPPMVIPTTPPLPIADRRMSMSHGNLSLLHVSHQGSQLRVPQDLSFITENMSFYTPAPVRPECQPSTSREPVPDLPLVNRTENDLFQLWKFCLLDHLDRLLGTATVHEALEGHFEGCDVKWNAENVGCKGIVKACDESHEFPNQLMRMIRYVARYPFDQSPGHTRTRVSYKGEEVEAFENICRQLNKYDQMMPNHTAHVLLQVVSIFMDRIPQFQVEDEDKGDAASPRKQENSTQLRGGRFARARPDRSRFNQLAERNCTTPLSSRFGGSLNLPVGRRPSQNEDSNQPEQPLHLPGSSAVARTPLRPPEIMDCALIKGIRPGDVKDLISAMSLVLLTLPPSIRRRLHFVIRFMSRTSANNCLRLQGTRENRYVVLERLASCIIRPSTPNSVPLGHAVLLVTFLMDHESKVFSVPEFLCKSVADLTAPRVRTPSSSDVTDSPAPNISPDKRISTDPGRIPATGPKEKNERRTPLSRLMAKLRKIRN